ncbi:MAG: RNase adapter RapZ [Gammaproteobacteria bacterium]|nr:RNase adapter RapZ [Gammaproteobacteria bacterium]
MKLSIISGRSGSGKSTALRALEDAGFNCIDNFPVSLLPSLVENAQNSARARGRDQHSHNESNIAVCIDARNTDLERFSQILNSLDRTNLDCEVIYLDALSATLVKRFSETRRRHPLTSPSTDLLQAIETEKGLLDRIADVADLTIDTTLLRGSELTELIRTRVVASTEQSLSLLFRSFGFKFGVPVDADMVFDIRCLPNPHWIEELRPLTGLDAKVQTYLQAQPDVGTMFDDVCAFLDRWIPKFAEDNRTYMTIAIGCTGGQHRSVYLAERLGAHFATKLDNVLVRHRQLDSQPATPEQD